MKPHYSITNLKPVTIAKRQQALRFDFSVTLGECYISIKGCLAGLNKDGYWVWGPRSAGFKLVDFNENLRLIILDALRKNGVLNLLEAPSQGEASNYPEIEF